MAEIFKSKSISKIKVLKSVFSVILLFALALVINNFVRAQTGGSTGSGSSGSSGSSSPMIKSLTKSSDKTSVKPGDTVNFTIKYDVDVNPTTVWKERFLAMFKSVPLARAAGGGTLTDYNNGNITIQLANSFAGFDLTPSIIDQLAGKNVTVIGSSYGVLSYSGTKPIKVKSLELKDGADFLAYTSLKIEAEETVTICKTCTIRAYGYAGGVASGCSGYGGSGQNKGEDALGENAAGAGGNWSTGAAGGGGAGGSTDHKSGVGGGGGGIGAGSGGDATKARYGQNAGDENPGQWNYGGGAAGFQGVGGGGLAVDGGEKASSGTSQKNPINGQISWDGKLIMGGGGGGAGQGRCKESSDPINESSTGSGRRGGGIIEVYAKTIKDFGVINTSGESGSIYRQAADDSGNQIISITPIGGAGGAGTMKIEADNICLHSSLQNGLSPLLSLGGSSGMAIYTANRIAYSGAGGGGGIIINPKSKLEVANKQGSLFGSAARTTLEGYLAMAVAASSGSGAENGRYIVGSGADAATGTRGDICGTGTGGEICLEPSVKFAFDNVDNLEKTKTVENGGNLILAWSVGEVDRAEDILLCEDNDNNNQCGDSSDKYLTITSAFANDAYSGTYNTGSLTSNKNYLLVASKTCADATIKTSVSGLAVIVGAVKKITLYDTYNSDILQFKSANMSEDFTSSMGNYVFDLDADKDGIAKGTATLSFAVADNACDQFLRSFVNTARITAQYAESTEGLTSIISLNLTCPELKIQGDIAAKGSIAPAKDIKVSGPAVVLSGSSIPDKIKAISAANVTFYDNYLFSQGSSDAYLKKLKTTISRLMQEVALNYNLVSIDDLKSHNPTGTWITSDDLNLSGNLSDVGTIIVNKADVVIGDFNTSNPNAAKPRQFLGLIVKDGNVTITSGTSQKHLAIYVFDSDNSGDGAINFSGSDGINYLGSMVAEKINFNSNIGTIQWDETISKNTPPGFSDIINPIIREKAR